MPGSNVSTSPDPSTATFGRSSGSDEGTGGGVNAMAVPAILDQPMEAIEDQAPAAPQPEQPDAQMVPYGGTRTRTSSTRRSTIFYIGDDSAPGTRATSTQSRVGRSVSPRTPPSKPGSARGSDRSKPLPIKDDKSGKARKETPGKARSVSRARAPATAGEILDSLTGPISTTPTSSPPSATVANGAGSSGDHDPRPTVATNGAPAEAQTPSVTHSHDNIGKESPPPQVCPSCVILNEQLDKERFSRQEERSGYQKQLELATKQGTFLADQIILYERRLEEQEKIWAEKESEIRQEAKDFYGRIETEGIIAEQKYANLKSENDNLRGELALADTSSKSLNETINGLSSELAKSIRSCTAKDETVARLERNIQKSAEYDKEGKQELAFQLAAAENILGEVQANLTAATAEIEKLKGQNSSGLKALESRSEEVSVLKYKIAELEHNSHVMTGKLRDNESLLENTQRELLDKREKDPEGSLVFTRKQADAIHESSMERVAKIQALELQLAECQNARGTLEATCNELRAQIGGVTEEKLVLVEEHRQSLLRYETGVRKDMREMTEENRAAMSVKDNEIYALRKKKDEEINDLKVMLEQEQSLAHILRSKIAASTTNLTGEVVRSSSSIGGPADKPGSSARAVSFDDGASKSRSRSRSVANEELDGILSGFRKELLDQVRLIVAGGHGGPPGGGGGDPPGTHEKAKSGRDRGRSPTVRAGASRGQSGAPGGPGDPDDGGGSDDDDDEEGEEEEEEEIEEVVREDEWEEVAYYSEEYDDLEEAIRKKRELERNAAILGVNLKMGKEAETIKVPAFPTPANLVNWRIQVGETLCAASAHNDFAEISWFKEATLDNATFEGLADSGASRFRSLDLKLAASMNNMIKSANADFLLSVTLKKQDAELEGKMLTGRQIAWLIYKYYQNNPNLQQMFTIRDLTDIRYKGDDTMHAFHYIWQSMLKHMGKNVLDPHTLRETLLSKIKGSKALENDLGHYYRQPEGHPDKTYDFLIRSMTSYIARTSQDKQQNRSILAAFEAQLRGGGKALAAPGSEEPLRSKSAQAKARRKEAKAEKEKALAAAAASKGNPKGKGKDKKGKGKGKAKGQQGDSGYEKPPCYFFNHGGCNKDPCRFAHTTASAKEAANMVKPGSRAPSPAKSRGNSPDPAKDKDKEKKKTAGIGYCRDFLKSASCKRGEKCPYAHVTEDIVKEMKRAQANKPKKT